MTTFPGITPYRVWLNEQIKPQYSVSEILDLGAFWTEAIVNEEGAQDPILARIYHIEPHQEESLKSLWRDWGYTLEGLDNDLLQKPIGLNKLGKFLAYTSQYEPGIDLKSLVANSGHLKPNRAIVLLLQTLKSLEAVYARGAAHFQLKPSNIILKPSGSIMVKNFGIYEMENLLAKQIGAQYLWDVAYFSPEHFGDQELTIASDIYSLGLILFELVTGKQPFSGQYQECMNAQMKSMPPNPQALNPEINIGLSRVMLRMLAKKKEQRFQSFSELRQALYLLLSPLEQVLYRKFTIGGETMLDDAEQENLNRTFNEIKGLTSRGESESALSKLENLVRMVGVREEFVPTANQLADQINKDKLDQLIQTAGEHLKGGFPFKTVHICQDILATHPSDEKAKSLFKQAFNLLDFRPLEALQPAIATEIHLKIAEDTNDSRALFALTRVLLADPQNEIAQKHLADLSAEKNPVEDQLEQIRRKRDEGGITEALAMVDAFLTQHPQNRRANLLKKQIKEQIKISSLDQAVQDGATIPINLVQDVGEDFNLDLGNQEFLEEGVLNVQIAIQNRKFESAKNEIIKLEDQFPNDPALTRLKAQLQEAQTKDHLDQLEKRLKHLLQIGDDNGSVAIVREILKINPSHPLAKAALTNLEKKRHENSPSHQLKLKTEEMVQQGQLKEALAYLAAGMSKVPQTKDLQDLRKRLQAEVQSQSEKEWLFTEIRTMIEKGNLAPAKEKLNTVLQRFPQDPSALELKRTLDQKLAQPQAPTPPAPPAAPAPPQPFQTDSGAPVPPTPQPTMETVPMPVQAPEPKTPAKGSPKKWLIPVVAIVVILGAAGGFFFYKKKQNDERLLNAYMNAEQIENDGKWEEARPLWKALYDEAPEFRDTIKRYRGIEEKIQNKEDQIAGYLSRAQSYLDSGYLYDDSNQNCVVMIRKVQELDPENQDAKRLLDEVINIQLQDAMALFEEDRVLEAREKYATIKEIEPEFSNPEFETKVHEWVQSTVVQPALTEIEKQIKRKKWDEAITLSDQLKEQVEDVPELTTMWNGVFDELQQSMESETRKNRILQTLELMVKIRPDDAALVMEKNELNRELNQAKIDNYFEKMETAYRKKHWITTGVNANHLLALDSEHEVAKSRLYEAIDAIKSQAQAEEKNHPSQAIQTYRGLLQVENMREYRTKIANLENRLKRFKSSADAIRNASNKPYKDLKTIVDKAVEGSSGFEKETNYPFIQQAKTDLEKDNENLQKLKKWEEQARQDTGMTYSSILSQLRKSPQFRFGFGQQERAKAISFYEDQVENYSGDLTIVVKQVKNLPKGSGLRKTPDAFAEIVVGNDQCVTDSVKSQDPIWNHICRVHANKGDSILVYIKSKGFVKKENDIGALRIPKIPESGKDLTFSSPDGWTLIIDVRRAR